VQTLVQFLPPINGGFLSFIFLFIMSRIPVAPYLAVLIGAGLGFLSCIAGQKYMNQVAINECKKQPDTHRLITGGTWMGTSKYCIHTRYLAQ